MIMDENNACCYGRSMSAEVNITRPKLLWLYTLMYEQGRGGPTRPTAVSSYSENVPPAQVSVRPYPCDIGALK